MTPEKKLDIAKASRGAGYLTLVGVLIVVGALLYSALAVRKLNREIASKTKQSQDLDEQIRDQERKLAESKQKREEAEQAVKLIYNYAQDNPQVAEKLDSAIKARPDIKEVVDDARNLPAQTQTSGNQPSRDKSTALAREREGFQALIAGDYDKAMNAFQAAEQAYNSFHNVYEIYRLIRKNKGQMNDPAKRKEVFQLIVKNYAYGAPADLWPQVVRIANS